MKVQNCSLLLLSVVVFICQIPTLHSLLTPLDEGIGLLTPRLWRFAVVTQDETPFGDTPPYLNIDVDLELINLPMMPDTEVVLFHYINLGTTIGSESKKTIGYDFLQNREWCCTQQLYDQGKCSDTTALYFKGVSNWTSVDGMYLVDPSSTIIYWDTFLGYPFDEYTRQTFLIQKITFDKEGIWYLLIAQCNDSHSVFVKGTIEWHNPFGYLSGVLFPFLPMYVCISTGFLVLLIVWCVYLVRYRRNLMGLQHVVTSVLIVALIENVLWSYDYISCNSTGIISDGVNIIGALLTSTKLTLIRTCILLVALGYSITVPSFEKKTKIYIILLTTCYWINCTLQQYVWVIRTMGFIYPQLMEFIVWIGSIIFNICYISWVAVSLIGQLKVLSAEKQTQKLDMFKKFAAFLIIFLLISVVLFFIQTASTALNRRDEMWKVWWLWDGYWEIGYFCVILLITYLWWPSENNERYAYSIQLQTGEELEDADKLPTTGGDGGTASNVELSEEQSKDNVTAKLEMELKDE